MICEKCGRRYGKLGLNYWDAKSGKCPICEGKVHASFFVTSTH